MSHRALVAGGLATALLMLWFVTGGDTATATRMRSDPEALELLQNAAGAAHGTSYQGVQFITAWSRSGTATTSLVTVTHVPGEGTRMKVQSTTAGRSGTNIFEADDSAQGDGTLTGYTPEMLRMLAGNYAVVRAGHGQVCGRPTTVIEARRTDGTTAGRFHIDTRTGLMLRRELLDGQGREVNLTMFTEWHPTAPRPEPIAMVAPQTIETPWAHELAGTDLGALRKAGWPVSESLPGNLKLYDARQLDGAQPVVHLGYTDGLSVVSVFLQRGALAAAGRVGWQQGRRGGRTVYTHDTVQQRAMWGSRGYVYTVMADAPPNTVDAAVSALPHGGAGFWTRIHRGMSRIASWANPFD